MIGKRIGLPDRGVFDAAYSAEMKVLEPRLEIKPIAIQATLDEIARTDPCARQVTAEQLIDRRFLQEMERTGRSTGSVCSNLTGFESIVCSDAYPGRFCMVLPRSDPADIEMARLRTHALAIDSVTAKL